MSVSTEDFMQHAVNEAEISALEWALETLENFKTDFAVREIKRYVAELKDEESNYGRE